MKCVIIGQDEATATVRAFDGDVVKDKVFNLSDIKSNENRLAQFIKADLSNKGWEPVDTPATEADLSDTGEAVSALEPTIPPTNEDMVL